MVRAKPAAGSDVATRRGRARRPASASDAGGRAPGADKPRREPPTAGRALATYEKLIATAGEIIGEVGFEKLTTNLICARAELTPPALYRYFDDKYEILEELARRLLKRQYDAYAVWLFQGGARADGETDIDKLAEWFGIAAAIVANQPGGVWTMRAMRALPNLAHVRLESQRMFTDQMYQFYRRTRPGVDKDLLWYRLRIRAEFGFVVDELAIEESEIPHDILFREAARIIGRSIEDEADAPSRP